MSSSGMLVIFCGVGTHFATYEESLIFVGFEKLYCLNYNYKERHIHTIEIYNDT